MKPHLNLPFTQPLLTCGFAELEPLVGLVLGSIGGLHCTCLPSGYSTSASCKSILADCPETSLISLLLSSALRRRSPASLIVSRLHLSNIRATSLHHTTTTIDSDQPFQHPSPSPRRLLDAEIIAFLRHYSPYRSYRSRPRGSRYLTTVLTSLTRTSTTVAHTDTRRLVSQTSSVSRLVDTGSEPADR